MRARLLFLLGLVALIVAIPAVAFGDSSRAAANATNFPDSVGEDPAAPDITSIDVSNDDAGMITFQVNISNRPELTQDMFMLIFVNTDQNTATGDPDALGSEFVIELDPGVIGMFQWNGTDYTQAPSQTSLTYAYGTTGATIHVSAADLGKTKALSFGALAFSGFVLDAAGNPDFTNLHVDAAPDRGHGFYSYQVLTKIVLSVTGFTIAPRPAKAGKTFSASLAATENDTGGPVETGTVACAASLAGKRLVAITHVVTNGVANCVWRIPKTAKGRTVRGTITLTVQDAQVSRTFSARVT
jgi:hypothetical protein